MHSCGLSQASCGSPFIQAELNEMPHVKSEPRQHFHNEASSELFFATARSA